MTDRAASRVLERLRAVEWDREWDDVLAHVMSRRLLMREYLRRAGEWAQAYSAEAMWPFFDVVEYVDSEFSLSPALASQLLEYQGPFISVSAVKRTCAGAVRLAEYRERHPDALPDLPDLYEPLLLFYERGGEFYQDNGGFLDLTGVLMRKGPLVAHAASPTLSSLDDVLLDAVDAAGRITYYTAADRQGPLLRRRVVRAETYEEAFGRASLYWEPTGEALPQSPERAAELGLVWLDEMEAAALIATAIADAKG